MVRASNVISEVETDFATIPTIPILTSCLQGASSWKNLHVNQLRSRPGLYVSQNSLPKADFESNDSAIFQNVVNGIFKLALKCHVSIFCCKVSGVHFPCTSRIPNAITARRANGVPEGQRSEGSELSGNESQVVPQCPVCQLHRICCPGHYILASQKQITSHIVCFLSSTLMRLGIY